jgi:hypothetical protein
MKRMRLVHSPDDVPVFATEAEEAAFWAEHAFADDWPTTADDVDPRLVAAKRESVMAPVTTRRR